MLSSLLGLLGTGFLADTIGIGRTFAIGGMLMTALGVLAFYISPLIYLKKSFEK